jgi:hypothetical protein
MHELETFLLSKPGITKPGKKSLGAQIYDSLISEEKMNRTFDVVVTVPEKLNIYIHEFYITQGYIFRDNKTALTFIKESKAIVVIISHFPDKTRLSVDPFG